MTYRKDLDALKGIAIIAVVLFHIGLLKSGYLGVDAFFVINGFLVVPALYKKIVGGGFSYFGFMEKKMLRLMPLVVIASFVCLLIGFIGMLPDNYENLAESVIASNIFSENILSAITTKNYWDVSNDYKPLMHLWYVGILFEFYLILPLLMMVFKKVASWCRLDSEKGMMHFLGVLFVVSLLLYLLPFGKESDKFYFIQYRMFELLLGGLIGLNISRLKANGGGYSTGLQWITSVLLIFVLISSLFAKDAETGLIQSKAVLLILTVVLTGVFIINDNAQSKVFNSSLLAYFGKRSYSIFIWHQVLLAFYRYFISNQITVWFVILFLAVVVGISELSYRFIEQKVMISHKSFAAWIVAAILICIPSGWIYLHAGVVRDVPEQNISFDNVHLGMHAEYCDRVYKMDNDFESIDKIKVLAVGNSFTRDFVNCLLESVYADSVEVSYVYSWNEKYVGRVKEADYIFCLGPKLEVPLYVWDNVKEGAEVWGIGTKSFGESNGIVYAKRNSSDYLNTTIEMEAGVYERNEEWSKQWGTNYINFVQMAAMDDRKVRVFTEEGKFISQDCRHLTKEGAQWYGKKIEWEKVFE